MKPRGPHTEPPPSPALRVQALESLLIEKGLIDPGAIDNLTMAAGQYNVDELRHAIERMAPARYLETSYYEHWLHAAEDLLDAKGVVTHEELTQRAAEIAQHSSAAVPRADDPGGRGAASDLRVPDAGLGRSE